jgi:hypothetical protein
MDVAKMILELRSEREHIQLAILSLERFGRATIGMAETAAQSRTELRIAVGLDAGS